MSISDLQNSSIEKICGMLVALGATQILGKPLAPNDNSKNQPYLSKGLSEINVLPAGEFHLTRTDGGNEILKSALSFSWLQSDGSARPAPHAKLIFYPQYPEIRLSGFLKGARGAPSDVLTTRKLGRWLLLGITPRREIIGCALFGESLAARGLPPMSTMKSLGVFFELPLPTSGGSQTTRDLLLSRLSEITNAGWHNSVRLNSNGERVPCKAQNCVGCTLEALLNVRPNSLAAPDFLGWELKATTFKDGRPTASKAVTLMTPEPDGGLYLSLGVTQFVKEFGYADVRGREDRLNFGGVFRVGRRHERTGLTLSLTGFDPAKPNAFQPDGKILLLDDQEREVAIWSFAKLLGHWTKKHAQAVYIPAAVRSEPRRQFLFSNDVALGIETDFARFLMAVNAGLIRYDPGIKLEGASGPRAAIKRRSQFRIGWGDLSRLYKTFETVRA